jgi:hypothetical protein
MARLHSTRSVRSLLLVGFLLLSLRGVAAAQCDGKPGPDGLSWDFDEGEKEKFSLFRFLGNVAIAESGLTFGMSGSESF